MSKNQIHIQRGMKPKRFKWLGYQFLIMTLATILIVSYVYTPPKGWNGWFHTITARAQTTLSQQANWLKQFVSSKHNTVQSKLTTASFTINSDLTRTSYLISASLDTVAHQIQGQEDVWIPNLNNSQIVFDLYTEQNHPIQITSVSVDKKPVTYRQNAESLHVQLPNTKQQGTVHIVFRTPVLQGTYRYGEKDNVWTIGYWYPILAVRDSQGRWLTPPSPQGFGDPFLVDNADYDITWTSPATFKWYTTGPVITSQQHGEQMTYEWKIQDVRNFAMVGSPRFIDHTLQLKTGTSLHIATLSEAHVQQLQEIAKQATDTYTDLFGAYYYPQLSVVEMPAETVFAHEYPGLALFSEDIWNWSTGEHWIAHEIAHGWWYYSVGDYEAENEWLDEGLAEYSSLLYVEHRYGKAAYDKEAQRLTGLWQNQESYLPDTSGDVIHAGSIVVDQPYQAFNNHVQYYYATYLRATVMYIDLRAKMGDSKFFSWLQQYYLKNTGKTATRTSLTHALQDVDASYVPVLNHWLDTPNNTLIQQSNK